MQLNPEVVKRSLSAHSAIGLVVGVLMYMVCLTGALAALAETFERWEQPSVEEFTSVTPSAVKHAMQQFQSEVSDEAESLWVVFPTPQLPRMHVTDGQQERFTDSDGSLGEAPVEGWTHMLRHLHIQLHLPQTVGLVLVSSLGAMLFGLIVSGLLAHPRLFRDAFQLRLGGSRRLEQADIHNRLSVWGLPFHLMISVTGAFYGLVGLLVISAAAAWYDGDQNALFDKIYGADPVLQDQGGEVQVERAMKSLARRYPDVSPIYVVAHKLGTANQFIEIAATVPARLAYSEIYRFDASGSYLGNQALTSGPIGRQFLYSLYRIHFGYFGGHWTRFIWCLLGLGLTVICVSGINVWLSKTQGLQKLKCTWAGFVWGTPLALALSALTSVFAAFSPLAVFLGTLGLSTLLSLRATSTQSVAFLLKLLCAGVMAALGVAHLIAFPPADFGEYLWPMNVGLIVTACLFVYSANAKR
ncbi:MAG: PepSY-associated TM helix domain-containing protein [Halioglobus sp.]